MLEQYNVTQVEIDEYLATIDTSQFLLNITVNGKNVYLDNQLWYTELQDTTAEIEIQKQYDMCVQGLLMEYFSDRLIEEELLIENNMSDTEKLDYLITDALDKDEFALDQYLLSLEIKLNQELGGL